ncbi:hypothetical protein MCEMIH16_02870 [Caulobacteraceae bacterium]
MTHGSLNIRQSRVKLAFMLTGCLAFVAIGVMLADDPGLKSRVIAWVSILFFGWCALSAVRMLLEPATLTADARCVSYRSPFQEGLWAWNEIDAITVRRIRGTTIVGLRLFHPARMKGFPGALLPLETRNIHFSNGWEISQQQLGERLTAMKAGAEAPAPSRKVDPIVM